MPRQSSPAAGIELIVAHYNEDLRWLGNIPGHMQSTVYTKAEVPSIAGAVRLPNIGREAHTYLHHIVTHYDALADLTVFCQGRPFDHAFDFAATMRSLGQQARPETGFTWLGHIIDTDDARGRLLFVPWSKNPSGSELALDAFHTALLGRPGPALYTFVAGGQFIASAACIRAQPRSFYERALQMAGEFQDAAHCFERCWDRVFGVEGIDKAWLAGRTTVYLKPIKRLAKRPPPDATG